MEEIKSKTINNKIFKIIKVQKDYFVYENKRNRNFKQDKRAAEIYFNLLVLDAELMQ